MIKVLILLSLTTIGCRHTAEHCSQTIHVCPGEGHGPCPFCNEEEVR